MSQCSYVNVKRTGTAEFTQSVQPSVRLGVVLAFTAPCPVPSVWMAPERRCCSGQSAPGPASCCALLVWKASLLRRGPALWFLHPSEDC